MKRAIIIGLIAIFLLPPTLSWSLQQGNVVMYFEPGLEKTIPFIVDNYDGPAKIFMVEVSTTSEELKGILDQVVHIREPELMIEAGKLGEFHADIKLPSELSHGLHEILVKVVGDKPNEKEGQIMVRKALGFYIRIYSLYPGKLVVVKLMSIDSGNIGEVLYFKTEVRNIGTGDINNARAKIDIYEGNLLIGTIYSDYTPIESKDVKELKANLLIPESYKVGRYVAKAVVEYDGKTQDAEYTQSFNIGYLNVEILNISSIKFENNKINQFDIDVESKWNKPIDVFAELILVDFSGEEKFKFKTQTVNVEGWGKTKIPAFINLKNIENGNYMLKIVLHYGEKTSRRTFAVEVSDMGEAKIVEEMPVPKETILIIIGGIIIVLLVIIIVLMVFFLRKKSFPRKKRR